MPFRTTQDRQVKVNSSDKMWSTGTENDNSLQYSCLENPMDIMKMLKYMMLKDEPLDQKVSNMLLWKSRGQLPCPLRPQEKTQNKNLCFESSNILMKKCIR